MAACFISAASGRISILGCQYMLALIHISARKMAKAAPISFAAQLTRPTQSINCYAMCDELGLKRPPSILEAND